MSRKWRERREKAAEAKGSIPAKPATAVETLRRRRNRRFLFVGLIAIAFPIFQAVAYQFRAITVSLVNRSDLLIKGLKVTYPGGDFDAAELKPGGSITRVIRPDFTFKGDRHFSTFAMSIRFTAENGQIIGQMGHIGGLDFSAQELYTIVQTPPEGRIQLQHTTRPGFPLSLVRDLMERLGFG